MEFEQKEEKRNKETEKRSSSSVAQLLILGINIFTVTNSLLYCFFFFVLF
jgi:hypothetical protein